MDESHRLLCFNYSELQSLRTALNHYLILSVVFDLNTANDSILDAIGYVQKSSTNCRIICITGRSVVGQTVNHPNSAISYVHSPIQVPKLRKQFLRSPPVAVRPFHGPCHGRSLLEIIQLLLFAGLSGRLSVWSAFMRGELWVHRTQLVHAECSGLQGQPALQALRELTRGTFRYQKGRGSQQTLQVGLYHPWLIASVPNGSELQDPADGGDALDEHEDEEVATRELSSRSSIGSADSPPLVASSASSGDNHGLAVVSASPSQSSSTRTSAPLADLEPDMSPAATTPEPATGDARSWLRGDDSEQRDWPAQSSPASDVNEVSDQWPRPILSPITPPVSSTDEPGDADALHISGDARTSDPVSATEQDCLEPFREQSSEAFWQQLCASETYHHQNQESIMAVTTNSVKEVLARLELTVEGFIGAAVADSDSGMCLGSIGGAGILNVEVAAAGNTEVVRAKRKAMKSLNIRDDIEDMLITLGKQYHLIRPLRTRPVVFIYIAVDRSRANLAMTRYALADAERELAA